MINIQNMHIFIENSAKFTSHPGVKKRKIVSLKLTYERKRFYFFLTLTLLMGFYTSPKRTALKVQVSPNFITGTCKHSTLLEESK